MYKVLLFKSRLYLCKESIVFPTEAEHFFFPADFRLKIFLRIFLDYSE